jgi:TetR/AcrR family transcriptional regulator, regulator of biofilm formation and stress response
MSAITSEAVHAPRRRGAPDRGTRERILRATLEIISEGGIAAVRNARVAGRAGVSPGSLTYCFTNQDEFLREALLLYVHEEVDRMHQLADRLRDGQLTTEEVALRLEAMISETLASAAVSAQFDLYLHTTRDPNLRAAATQALAAYDDVAIAALTAAGIPHPERHAAALVALADGLTLRYLAEGRTSAPGIAAAYLTYLNGAREQADD